MTCEILRDYLRTKNVQFKEGVVPHGTRFDCKGGETFNVYNTGKMSFQRKQNTPLALAVKELYEGVDVLEDGDMSTTVPPTSATTQGLKPVFIVYGHDVPSRDQLELIIRRMGLEPIVLGNLAAAGDTVIEKLEKFLGEHGNVGFACVLLTPDDQGYKVGRTEELKYRARQNVVLELGMVLARLGRRRVAILHKQSIELPSDIAGLLYIPYVERVEEVKNKLYTELREAGYEPNAAALY